MKIKFFYFIIYRLIHLVKLVNKILRAKPKAYKKRLVHEFTQAKRETEKRKEVHQFPRVKRKAQRRYWSTIFIEGGMKEK